MTAYVGAGALAAGLLLSVLATAGWAARGRRGEGGRPRGPLALTAGAAAAAVVACVALEVALVTHDFSLRYVAENGGRDVPLYYRVTALWAALEGSLLLWLLVLTGLTLVVAARPPARAAPLHPWASAVLTGLSAAFFAVAVAGGNAFERVDPVPADGPGPNPLLQDAPLMGIHPPLLYLGYVGLAVPFAYAVAALVHPGRDEESAALQREWPRVVRGWTIAAWAALSAGSVLGAWWSYAVLGWGGYWAWDPVENASLLPWLTATALLHALLVQERRAALPVWGLSLACASFLLVVLGTFLTRSGVVDSVHAFSASTIGPLLLALLVGLLAGVLALFTWRAGRLGPVRPLGAPLSRESVLVANNVVLVSVAAVVLLGTLLPALVQALTGEQVAVGEPYFERFVVPAALVLLVLMAVGPLVRWRADSPASLASRAAPPVLAAAAAALAGALAGAEGRVLPVLGLAAAVATTPVRELAGDLASRSARSRLLRRRRRYGAHLAHLGLALAAVAVSVSAAHTSVVEDRLSPGETVTAAGTTVRLVAVERVRDARFMAVEAVVEVERDGKAEPPLRPRLSFWPEHEMVVGTPAVRSGVTGDVYVTVTAAAEDGRWADVRLAVNPLLPWLWASGAVMVVGAALAGFPGRGPAARPGPPVPRQLAADPPAEGAPAVAARQDAPAVAGRAGEVPRR